MNKNKYFLLAGIGACLISLNAHAVDASSAPSPGTGNVIQSFDEKGLIKDKLSIVVEHNYFDWKSDVGGSAALYP